MNVGRKVVRTLIVVFEGCVVKLKEIEACLEDRRKDEIVPTEIGFSLNQNSASDTSLEESYFNISLLDNYIVDLDLPVGSNFMKIIQKTELKTEYNIICAMINSLSKSNIDDFYAIYDSIKDCKFVVFKYISPSPLRKDEGKVVDKQFIIDELKELSLSYDEGRSLYDNCLKVIEYRQKLVMDSIVTRFGDTIEKTQLVTEELQKARMIQVLMKELEDRKQIVEMKLNR